MVCDSPARFDHVTATVTEILPATGLAYLTDNHASDWTVTRSTPGVGLDHLQPGQRLDLKVAHHELFSIVSAYTPLD
jgi:hypothetical protein